MSNTAERRIAKVRAYIEDQLSLVPQEKDENETWEDEAYDWVRDSLSSTLAQLSGPLGDTFGQIHITGEGFRSVGVYRAFYLAALRTVRAARAKYEADVRDWYENGDGRSPDYVTDESGHRYNVGGQGHAYPECIHGASLWTDYDNICGGCEESLTASEEARGIARERYLRFNQRWDWVCNAPGDLNHHTRTELNKWAISLYPTGLEGATTPTEEV